MVVGSGAAGMTAALTAAHHGLRVVVIEKTGRFGGSTARSGGGIWAPGNEVLRQAGVRRHPGAGPHLPGARGGRLRPGGAAAGAAGARARPCSPSCAPATPVDFAWVPGYADYYPEAPGGLAQGRSIEPVPLDGRVLGAELAHLNPPYLPAPNGVTITQADYRWLSLGPRHPRAILASAKIARPDGTHPPARAPHPQHGPGPGGGPAGGPDGPAGTGLAGHPHDRPAPGGRPGHRGRGDPRRPARADPGQPRRGAGRRRFRAQRGDAAALPAPADRHRVDDRLGRQHRRRDRRGRGGRGGARPHGRRLVGPVHTAVRRAVLLPGRAQPARLPPGQRRRAAVRERVGPVRRRRARDVRRSRRAAPRTSRPG